VNTPTPPPEPQPLRQIHTREEFIELSKELGVRADWHEPDEQEVDVRVYGRSFDNAGFWPQQAGRPLPGEIVERYVVFLKDGKRVAAVNLATLCAWASEPHPSTTTQHTLDDGMYREVVQRRYEG